MQKHRDPYWDNLKFVLIFLVVLGHFLMPAPAKGQFARALYYWIYIFHMQAFVFVSGYTSKNYVRKKGKEEKLTGFLVTFFFFSICIEIIEFIFTQGVRPKILYKVTGAPWYMLAMFFWYLLIPFVSRIRPAISIPVAILAAVVCGMFPECGSFLSISRVIVFFPAFLAGYYFDGAWINRIDRRSRFFSWAVLITCFAVLLFRRDAVSDFLKIIYAKSSYDALDISDMTGSVYRLLWYGISALMTFSLMNIIPKERLLITYVGERTLSIYIVHRLIRDVFKYLDLYRYLGSGIRMLALCVLISCVVVYVASAKPIFNFVNSVFRFNTLFRRNTQAVRG